MFDFRFDAPWWLLLWIPVVWLGIRTARRSGTGVLYSEVRLLAAIPRTGRQLLRAWLPWLRVAGLALIVLALARPQRGMEEFRVRTEGIAIEMCIDRSGSMLMPVEGEKTSLDVVHRVFRDFVAGSGPLKGRPDDLIGLVAFGTFAESKCPLTLDHTALLEMLDSAVAETLPDDEMATAIGDAVALAVDRIRSAPAKSRVIILLSDGMQTAGVVEPKEAAEAAKALGLKIYTIGIGFTPEGAGSSAKGPGEPAPDTGLDETALQMMADTTGGKYFPATSPKALERVYADIDRLEKTATESRTYSRYRELFLIPAALGLALVLVEIALASTRLRCLTE